MLPASMSTSAFRRPYTATPEAFRCSRAVNPRRAEPGSAILRCVFAHPPRALARLAISFAVGDRCRALRRTALVLEVCRTRRLGSRGPLTAPARMVYHRDVLCRGYSD